MVILNQDRPLFARPAQTPEHDLLRFRIELAARLAPAKHERAGVDGMPERLVDQPVADRPPDDGVRARDRAPDGEGQALGAPPQEDLPGGAQLVELLEHASQRGLHRLVARELKPAQIIELVAGRRDGEGLTAARLVPACLHHPVHDAVALQLADLTADAEHHAVGARRRIVEPLLVGDQGVGPAAQIDQVVPVEVVARQARQLEAHDDADLAACDGGHHAAEAAARLGQRAALALVLVDDDDALAAPAQLRGLLGESVLKPLALEVVSDLAQ